MAAEPKPSASPASDSAHVANLRTKRQTLVDKLDRIVALPEHRDHDHDQALKRCRDGIAEIDREIRQSGSDKDAK